MNHPLRPGAARDLAAIASALLWGVVEFVALARSRWSVRPRLGPGARPGHRRG